MGNMRIIQKTPEVVKKKSKAAKVKNRTLLEDQLTMYLNLPDQMMQIKGWTEEELDSEIERLQGMLGHSLAGAKARRKGSTYENDIRDAFKEHWGIQLVRTPSSGGFQKQVDNELIRGDLSCLDKLIRFLLHIECKNQVTWKPKEWFDQALDDCPVDNYPLVIMHQAQKIEDGKRVRQAEDFVMMRLNDFLEIVDQQKVIIRNVEGK